jgi:hypothetical protein
MSTAKEFYALEIYEDSKYAPPHVWCRTDLFPSKEKAKEALLDVNTRTAFTCLYDSQFMEESPNLFEGNYDDIDDYANAYFDGVEEVVYAVNSLFAWIRGERESWNGALGLEFGFSRFTAHVD